MVIVSSDPGPVPEHPRIERRGPISDRELFSLYREAELLIQPSLYEGFGLPPLEAMSVGCPVVASCAASLPEVCGDAAFFVDPFDEESIRLGMNEVLENQDLRSRLVAAGSKRIGLFSWEKAASAITDLFFRETAS
jgi:glycosyltransferase involved in cell wall biosynthesis